MTHADGSAPAQALGPSEVDAERRLTALARLYGDAGLARLRAGHVAVVGIGGVGSWAAEALARSGVGRLTLVDLDHVAESNLNRQVHALVSTLGAAKVDVMKRRIADLAPDCRVDVVDDFVTADNLPDVLPAAAGFDAVVDAIDQPRAKAAMIAWLTGLGVPVIVCGAAGGRTDPLRLRREDLALTKGDALLSSVRARLRRDYGFARPVAAANGKPARVPVLRFGIEAISSDEPVRRQPTGCEPVAIVPNNGAPLNCAGYGSIVTVTAAMGLAAAQRAIDRLISPAPRRRGSRADGMPGPAATRARSPG